MPTPTPPRPTSLALRVIRATTTEAGPIHRGPCQGVGHARPVPDATLGGVIVLEAATGPEPRPVVVVPVALCAACLAALPRVD